MATKPKTTAITKKTTSTTKSSGSDAVRKIQTDLNKKGANLKVDGIQGKLTNAALAKYGTPSSNVTKAGKDASPILNYKNSAAAKANSKSSSNSSSNTKVIPTSTAKNSNNIFSTIAKGFKDSLNNAKAIAPKTLTAAPINAPMNFGSVTSFGDQNKSAPSTQYRDINTGVVYTQEGLKSAGINPNSPNIDKGQSSVPLGFNPVLGGGDFSKPEAFIAPLASNVPAAPAPISSTPTPPAGSGGTTTNKSTTTLQDGTTITQTSPEMAVGYTSPAGATLTEGSANITNSANNIMALRDSSINDAKNYPWTSTATTNADIIKYNEIATTNLARNLQSMEQFNVWSASPGGQKFFTDNPSITPEAVASKIQPVVNGVVSAQTTPEYLANLPKSYASLEPERQLLNEQMALEQGWTKEQKDILVGADGKGGMLATQKTEAQATIDALKIQIDNREQRIKDKLKLEIQKNNEELKVIDADLELQQLAAKSSMTGLLAKLGALDTSGAAMGALQNVDAKYDTEQARLRAKVAMANSELKLNAEIAIDDLEGQYDNKVLEINSDLSKSEREIRLDIMKLDYETKKDMLQVKMKWQDAIQTQKDKYEAASKKAAEDWTSEWFTTAGANLFKDMPKEFQLEWMNNNFFGKKPDGYKTGDIQVGQQFVDYQKTQPVKQDSVLTNTQIAKTIAWMKNEGESQESINMFLNGSSEEQSFIASEAGAI